MIYATLLLSNFSSMGRVNTWNTVFSNSPKVPRAGVEPQILQIFNMFFKPLDYKAILQRAKHGILSGRFPVLKSTTPYFSYRGKNMAHNVACC